MATKDIMTLYSPLDFSLSLFSVLDDTMKLNDESMLSYTLDLVSLVDISMQLPSAADLEERDPL